MDQHHNFPSRRDREKEKRAEAALAAATLQDDEAQSKPVSPDWDSGPEGQRWLAGGQLAAADARVEWRINGWLAMTGTSVWYGAGSTGKTQLMLWMAAMIASRVKDRKDHTWLGARVNGTGHVLILTAEDTREQVMMRLRDVIRESMGQVGEDYVRTCSRLHVMPFLSMTEREFKHANPSLMAQDADRSWRPSDVLLEIRRYIREWNRVHELEEDRIVGVVMDSATSMSGFDSLDAQATTNFFFYLGRLCERLEIFWAVIGHTPKVTSIPRQAIRETAASRLRGVAMWTTAPRLTVEVRLIQEWGRGSKKDLEEPGLRAWLGPHWRKEDILVVAVAKANLQHAARDERHLVRLRRGAFVDVTGRPEDVRLSGMLDPDPDDSVQNEGVQDEEVPREDLSPEPGVTRKVRRRRGDAPGPGRRKLDDARFDAGTDLVREVLLAMYGGLEGESRIIADRVAKAAIATVGDRRAKLVRTASGGATKARPGTISWHLARLAAVGMVEHRGRHFHLVRSDR